MNAQPVSGMISMLSTVALLPGKTLPAQNRLPRLLSKCLESFKILVSEFLDCMMVAVP